MDAVKILGSLLRNNALGSSKGSSILDSLLGGAAGGPGGKGGKAGDILEVLLGGQKRSHGGGMGALGAILAAATGSRRSGSRTGGNAGGTLDLLGSLLGGAAASGKLGGLGSFLGGENARSGGLGGLLGSVLGAAAGSRGGGLSSILGGVNPALGGGDLLGLLVGGGQSTAPPQEAQEEAEILIEAMCHAAKCDGSVDEAERAAILGKMDELAHDEIKYLCDHFDAPLDLENFLERVPGDMAEQVYAFSLMAVRVDTRKEVEFFDRLARGLSLDGVRVKALHERLGQPKILA